MWHFKFIYTSAKTFIIIITSVWYYYLLSVKLKHPGEICGWILFVNIVVTSGSGWWLADERVWSFMMEFCVKIDVVWDIAIKNSETNHRWGWFLLTNTELMWSEPHWIWICVRIWCNDESDLIVAEDEIWFCYISSELEWYYSTFAANSASVWLSLRTYLILFDGPVNLRAELLWNSAGDELYNWMGTMIEHSAEVQRLLQPVIFRRFFEKTGFYYFYCG